MIAHRYPPVIADADVKLLGAGEYFARLSSVNREAHVVTRARGFRIVYLGLALMVLGARADANPANCRPTSCSCTVACSIPEPGDSAATSETFICPGPTPLAERFDVFDQPEALESLGFRRVDRGADAVIVVAPLDGATTGPRWTALVARITAAGGSVEPNHTYRPQSPPPTPNDNEFASQWPLAGWSGGSACLAPDPQHPAQVDPFCQPSCTATAALAPLVPWAEVASAPPDQPVLIGVIDSIPHRHADLDPHMWTNPLANGPPPDEVANDVHGYNAVNDKGIDAWALDQAHKSSIDHGTSVASIIAAVKDNQSPPGAIEPNLAGLAPSVRIIPCKVDRKASHYAKCLWYFVNLRQQGVPVAAVNISGGGLRCSCCIEGLIRKLRDLNVVVVAASGNNGCPNDAHASGSLDSCGTWGGPSGVTCDACPFYPASHPVSNIVAVGGAACSGTPARCSNYGRRSVHLLAPGDDVSTLATSDFQGTSAAAPHVTGAIALLAATEVGKSLDWRGLRSRILAGGQPTSTFTTTAAPVVQERGTETVTGRNLLLWQEEVAGKAAGAVSCAGQTVRRRLLPQEDSVQIVSGSSLPLRILAINCATSEGSVPVEAIAVSNPQATTLKTALLDNGAAPDECAGDGEHAADWSAPPGQYVLHFWNGAAPSEDLQVEVLP